MSSQILKWICFVLIAFIAGAFVAEYMNTKKELEILQNKNNQLNIEVDSIGDKLDSIKLEIKNRTEFIKAKQIMFKFPDKFIKEGHFNYLEMMVKKYNVSLDLVLAQIKQESNYRQFAVSSAGAKGYLQMIDLTAVETSNQLKYDNFNIYDAKTNLEFGVYYLSKQLKRFDGNIRLALAAYNAGPTIVKRLGRIPRIPETQNYVKRIVKHYNRSQI